MARFEIINNKQGTLGSVCAKYYKRPLHIGCPFVPVCSIKTGSPEESVYILLFRGTTSAQLREMADCIDGLEKEVAF